MSNIEITTQTHALDHSRTYLISLIVLLVITVIEYLIGFTYTSSLKIVILMLFSLFKAAIIIAIFMHVKYHKDWKTIISFGFIIPLFQVTILFAVLYFDFGIEVTN